MAEGDAPVYKAPLFKNERATFERVQKFISKEYFVDCNLYGRLYGETVPTSVKHYDFGHEHVSFAEASARLSTHGASVKKGFEFGGTWTTHWFQVDVEIPCNWEKEHVVFRFDASCEALIWRVDGRPVQGLSPDVGRTDYSISPVPSVQRLFIEASANERNGDGRGGMIQPADLNKTFQLRVAEIAIFNRDIFELLMDFDVLLDLSEMLPKESSRRYQALYTANHMINELVGADFSLKSQKTAHECAKRFFSQKNGEGQMTLYAVGNCHIDTAWLWRFSETKRKCARSWASALSLMDSYNNMTFAISQAQQLIWLRESYPSVYEDLLDRAIDGRLVGVGGAWVEMDGNLPSGESIIRQLLYGQREFKRLFLRYSKVFWLPDTFGYSAQLPQIMRHCGMEYFVTQKMSWSLVNKFPHHSFHWHGIDGTRVLAHFPPHHYVAQITAKECIESAANFTDGGRSGIAMMLYGHGDGGGGPDEAMLCRARRLADCDGVPRVLHATPEEFFAQLEKHSANLCSWFGELYLELHNATYTTQAKIKMMNRLIEGLLRDHEFLQAVEVLESGRGESLAAEWKILLLNQFHDVLPGTCIKEVVTDALTMLSELLSRLVSHEGEALKMIYGLEDSTSEKCSTKWFANTCGWTRIFFHQKRLLQIPPFSVCPLNELKSAKIKTLKQNLASELNDGFLLENTFLSVKINKSGQLSRCLVKSHGKDGGPSDEFDAAVENSPGNRLVIFDDVPLFWDAWDVMDYHLETRRALDKVESIEIVENSPVHACIRVKILISEKSTMTQQISLRVDLPYIVFDCAVCWNESHKFLKVEFPVNVLSATACYDIQFGHVERPTHRNTSWDAAKYEVCGHKWMCLAEHNRGAALLNDSKYGHCCEGSVMRLSLLRSSKAPDDTADVGSHRFSYAFYPFVGSMQRPCACPKLSVMRAAFEFNNPIRVVDNWRTHKVANIFGISGSDGVVIETIKRAENDGNALVLRLYECFGGGCRVQLLLNHPRIMSVDIADALEESITNIPIETTEDPTTAHVVLDFRSFEIKTLLVRLFAL